MEDDGISVDYKIIFGAPMIIADTGFWVALFNRRDSFHYAVKKSIARLNEPLHHHYARYNRSLLFVANTL
ncbi:hypothetical protein CCP3SC1_960008 [Gammaproteobacteria bacterium]